jgi:hypothetical protein
VSEELGDQVRYILGEPKVFFRVERQEHDQDGRLVRIFGIGYDAQYELFTEETWLYKFQLVH